MAYLDFFAARDDQVNLVGFLFSQTDVRIFESYSQYDQALREFTTVQELDSSYPLGVDRYGNGFSASLQLWSRSVMPDMIIRHINLKPEACGGHTFRYCIEGGALMQLYFGGVHDKTLTRSHYGHNTPKSVQKLGSESGIDWKALSKLSNKIQYHIRKRVAVARASGRPVLAQAYDLVAQGFQLQDAANVPWVYEIDS